jgi:hypothetical protein
MIKSHGKAGSPIGGFREVGASERCGAPNLAEIIRFPAIPAKTRKNCDWFAAAYPVKPLRTRGFKG